MFENSVPGLPEAAAKEELTPLEYMRRYGAFKVDDKAYSKAHEQPVDEPARVVVDGVRAPASTRRRAGSSSTRRRSPTGAGPSTRCRATCPVTSLATTSIAPPDEFDLLPNFRLPTLIHTRSPVKWLYEISHNNPLWIATGDASRLGIATGDLVKVHDADRLLRHARLGHRRASDPASLGMSHHLGRWRLHEDTRRCARGVALVKIERDEATARYTMRQVHGAQPFESNDPDSARVWWSEVGVHQNLTFPVQPDPVSGMHCWHQRVTVEKAGPDDRYGDIMVDTEQVARAVSRSGWRRRGRRPVPTACVARCGSIGRCGR